MLRGVKYELRNQNSNFTLKHKPQLHTHSTHCTHSCTDWPRKTRQGQHSETRPPKMIARWRKSLLKARVDEEWFCGLPASTTTWRFLWHSQIWRVIDNLLPEVTFKEGAFQTHENSCFDKPDYFYANSVN